MNKDREEKFKKIYSRNTKEELIEKLIQLEDKKINEFIDDVSREELEKNIKEELKKEMIDKIKLNEYINKFLYNSWGGHTDFNSPKDNIVRIAEQYLATDPDIKNLFIEQFKKNLSKNMDKIINNIMYKVFLNGIANTSQVTSLINESVSEAMYNN